MKDIFKKIIVLTYITFILISFFTPFNLSFAQDESEQCTPPKKLKDGRCVDPPNPGTCPGVCPGVGKSQENTYYTLLEPLPGVGDKEGKVDTASPDAFGKYINAIIILFIGICAVLAVVMIVIGGIEYSTSELISSKEAGIEKIKGALLGLLLALGAFLLLKQINPDLLNLDVAINPVELTVTLQEFLVLKPDGTLASSKGGPINPKLAGGACDPRAIKTGAATAGAGYTLTDAQANVLSCLAAGSESNCEKTTTNYAWDPGHTAYGPFQILLDTHSTCFENQACYNVVGISAPEKLNCPNGAKCKAAAGKVACSAAAASCVLKKQGFSAWAPANDPIVKGKKESHATQRACVAMFGFTTAI